MLSIVLLAVGYSVAAFGLVTALLAIRAIYKQRDAAFRTQYEEFQEQKARVEKKIKGKPARPLDSGVPVDSQTSDGHTAIHYAAQSGHLAAAQHLLERERAY